MQDAELDGFLVGSIGQRPITQVAQQGGNADAGRDPGTLHEKSRREVLVSLTFSISLLCSVEL